MDKRHRPPQMPRSTSDDSPAESTSTSHSETGSSNRASPSPADAGSGSAVDFQFLNFSHPSEAKASGARRTVRSHVTRQQHQREHAAAAARRAQNQQQQLFTTGRAVMGHSTLPTTAGPASAVSVRNLQLSHASAHSDTRSTIPYSVRTNSTSAQSSSTETPSTPPSPTTPSDAQSTLRRVDLTRLYPEEWISYIPRILNHYQNTMLGNISDIDGPDGHGLLRSRFFPIMMTDQASCHAMMLIATSHYSNVYGPQSHPVNLLGLRGMAIQAINAALEDPSRATSDQIIAAVAKLASYEAIYGDRNTFHTHMTGLLRMVSLRGGLPALGLDGVLERILLWIDSNAAYITHSHVYFNPAAFPSRMRHPRPDPHHFAGVPARNP